MHWVHLLSVGSEVQILSGTPESTAASLFRGLQRFFVPPSPGNFASVMQKWAYPLYLSSLQLRCRLAFNAVTVSVMIFISSSLQSATKSESQLFRTGRALRISMHSTSAGSQSRTFIICTSSFVLGIVMPVSIWLICVDPHISHCSQLLLRQVFPYARFLEPCAYKCVVYHTNKSPADEVFLTCIVCAFWSCFNILNVQLLIHL